MADDGLMTKIIAIKLIKNIVVFETNKFIVVQSPSYKMHALPRSSTCV